MVREVNKLTALAVKKMKPGRHNDGGGLYLFVQPNGNRSWIFRWRDRITGKLRDKGLGPSWDVSLEKAREYAKQYRQQVRDGGDPINDAHALRLAKRAELAKQMSFAQCATAYIEAHQDSWRNDKHRLQWSATLGTYAAPINPLPVSIIDTALVLRCLEPIWNSKTETATRVRQRIESVLDWAGARGYRTSDNPARWKGHLDKLLPKPSKLKNVIRRAALPYVHVGAFMARLRDNRGIGARALELQILTACRPGEVAAAAWKEINLATATWIIPGKRMKAGIEHRVPLSGPALSMLTALKELSDDSLVFPGVDDQPITTAAMLKAARVIEKGIDAHGFRSTFRDWAAERTNYPSQVVESALAHRLKDKAEAAYFRSDLFEKRAKLMRDWARYCDTIATEGNITPISRARSAAKNPASAG